jgi:V-type H+-transporting ATPase subunit a
MINNFLAGGNNVAVNSFTGESYDNYLFENQKLISETFVYLVIISVPLFLCVKPCIALCCGPKDHAHDHEEPSGAQFDEIAARHEEFGSLISQNPGYKKDLAQFEKVLVAEYGPQGHHGGVGEIFIHQMIETIEFVLGCISNTASYLRLWALSLAHSQLALVFIQYTLKAAWSMAASQDYAVWFITLTSFIMWFPFMAVTGCVLLNMDVLECFLHTLRLHWVEFQSKFFVGSGYLYVPFCFKAVYEKQMYR